MTITKTMLVLLGLLVIIGVLVGHYYTVYGIWFTLFVGFDMLLAGVTGFSFIITLLKKLGVDS